LAACEITPTKIRIGSHAVNATGGWQAWTDVECTVAMTDCVHNLYLQVVGETSEKLLNLDYFQFDGG
jgi:arabinoxylan arabinofuranohydrolase